MSARRNAPIVAFCILGLSAASVDASQLSESIGLDRGVCVVLGDDAVDRAVELAADGQRIIYVQLSDDKDRVDSGLLGRSLFVGYGPLSELHLGSDIADVVLVSGEPAGFDRAEAMRVIRPLGRLITDDDVTVKPMPAGVEDWSHPYHGPDNNPQSADRLARAPYMTRFLADPRYAPVPQSCVASAGRVFKAFGNVAFKKREEAYLNTLVAFNGYNGTILWQRDLVPGIMVHRNTMIATPERLYVGNNTCCQVIDAATGRLLEEIVPPTDVAGGTFWKWMALRDGVLYAVIGADELLDPTTKRQEQGHGWSWERISEGYNQQRNEWGFGRNLLAIDLATKRVLWHHHEQEPIDCRAVCMNDDSIFLFRFGHYLVSIDAETGHERWRRTKAEGADLFASLGEELNRQSWQTNWRTVAYLKCSDTALYFAGPQVRKLLAVSAADGEVLWENSYDNFQLVLRGDELYGISGPWGNNVSRKFDAASGAVLASYDVGRRACTRVTGAVDAIFTRAQGGSQRLDIASGKRQWLSPMRPVCFDGVIAANGCLYWFPFTCDCQLQLYGVTCLGPAGDFDFTPTATDANRLTTYDNAADVAPLDDSGADWTTYRADRRCTATTTATVPQHAAAVTLGKLSGRPTAPVAAGGYTFVADDLGHVLAIDTATGITAWQVQLAGPIHYPPTIWRGRALIGAGDGCVYALEAKTGRRLWRFRAAPRPRLIPVYGRLMSTWPVGSGVTVSEDGTAYCAAGIVNYDGTYVFALDAETGRIRWQNNTSGHLDAAKQCGASVQGHLLLDGDRLYMAGGTSLSPAVYDTADGACLNDTKQLEACASNQPRGSDLYLVGDRVVACGRPLYTDPDNEIYDDTVHRQLFHASNGEVDIAWLDHNRLMAFRPLDRSKLSACVTASRDAAYRIEQWGRFTIKDEPLWQRDCPDSVAAVLADNAVVLADQKQVTALDARTGAVLWSQDLPVAPVSWGLAVDREGRAIVTLADGRVMCVDDARKWLIGRFDEVLFPSIASMMKEPATNESGGLAWGASYLMAGLAEMLDATHDPKYADAFVKLASWVADGRDSLHGRKDDYRGKAVPAWGSGKYTGDRHYVWAVHTGMIAAPMAHFAAVVLEDSQLKQRFGADARRLLEVARDAVAVHDEQYRQGPGDDEGYLYGLHLKKHLPLNQQNALARAWLYIDRATGKPLYRERITRLATFLKRRMWTAEDDACVWAYWTDLDGPGNGREDISHAAINVDFAALCSEDDIVFDRHDVRRLNRTLLNHVMRDDGISDDVGGESGVNKHAPQVVRWGRLARTDGETYERLLAFLRAGRFPNATTDPLGLALLTGATPRSATRPSR